MKIGFIIPLIDDFDVETAYKNIDKVCKEVDVEYEIIFSLNSNLDMLFTKIRNTFVDNPSIKAFKTDKPVGEHKLITIAMGESEEYDAVVIYSGKEETNYDVIKTFLISYIAGNKIVYLKKVYRGWFSKVRLWFKSIVYRIGVKMLGIFNDPGAENDIQLLDSDVVRTINQLPERNQLLRTLDSLINYQTDVVHLEVDPNEYVNPLYEEKGKSYKLNFILYLAMTIATFSFLLTEILLVALKVKLHYLFHIMFGALFIICLFLTIVFYTKKNLSVRVGNTIDKNELDALIEKAEFYNF